MHIDVYENPARNGVLRVVYDGGESITQVDPTCQEVAEVGEVPFDWIRLAPAPSRGRITAALSYASDAATAWNEAVRTKAPLGNVGALLLGALGNAVLLLGEIDGGRS